MHRTRQQPKWIIATWCSVVSVVTVACVVCLLTGQESALPWLAAAMMALIVAGSIRVVSQRKSGKASGKPTPISPDVSTGQQLASSTESTRDSARPQTHSTARNPSTDQVDDPTALAQQMLEVGRYALLLRPQIAANLGDDQLQQANTMLDEAMGIVPEGDVLLESWHDQREAQDTEAAHDRIIHVEALYLDRHAVTNRQFQDFVDDGGYERISLWDPKIWPAVLDFVDRDGYPGPRSWTDGHFPDGLEDHPVVGVSWYEAAAFARWVGKRLPSDPEWVKAGSWPIAATGNRPTQRRYPWGDAMDSERANIWGAGPDHTTPVGAMSPGVSVGGIYDLIGNVWEWTSSDFGAWDTTPRRLNVSMPLKSLRGGAFDTYFQTQANCQFQSGEGPINRKHNIGFRCALALCDVIPVGPENDALEDESLLATCSVDAGEEQNR